jgi:hypothetical protein
VEHVSSRWYVLLSSLAVLVFMPASVFFLSRVLTGNAVVASLLALASIQTWALVSSWVHSSWVHSYRSDWGELLTGKDDGGDDRGDGNVGGPVPWPSGPPPGLSERGPRQRGPRLEAAAYAIPESNQPSPPAPLPSPRERGAQSDREPWSQGNGNAQRRWPSPISRFSRSPGDTYGHEAQC